MVSKIKFDAKTGIETPRSTESLSYGSKGNVSPIDCDVSCVTNVATICSVIHFIESTKIIKIKK